MRPVLRPVPRPVLRWSRSLMWVRSTGVVSSGAGEVRCGKDETGEWAGSFAWVPTYLLRSGADLEERIPSHGVDASE